MAPAAAQTKPKRSKVASLLSGSTSGALVSACVQPLDVLRTRMQADAARGVYNNTLATARAIVDQGGVRALWQGTQPTVFRLAFGAGVHFFLLETVRPIVATMFPSQKQRQGKQGGDDGAVGRAAQLQLSPGAAALVGGLSRTLAAIVACPFTVVKTRMEYVAAHAGAAAAVGAAPPGAAAAAAGAAGSAAAAGGGQVAYRSTLHALSSIAQTEGVRGLYRGLGPTVLSNAPFSALYYMFYTQLQQKLGPSDGSRPGAGINFVSGVVAAVAATLITQPADVIRTRVQLGVGLHGHAQASAAAAAATSAAAAAAGAGGRQSAARLLLHIASAQGARGLLAGAAPRVLKRTLQTALVWTLYEEIYPRLAGAGDWMAAKAETMRRSGNGSGGGAGSSSRAGGSEQPPAAPVTQQ